MNTVFWWDESIATRVKPGYIPEIEFNIDCIALKTGDKLKICIDDYTDDADVIVQKVDISIQSEGATQYVWLVPDWNESEDKQE